MSTSAIGVVIGVLILAGAIPYAARIRHPEQKAVAAYFIFVVVFVAAAVLFFNVFGWLATRLGFETALATTVPALLFLLLIFIVAIAVATWQIRKPPIRRSPPP